MLQEGYDGSRTGMRLLVVGSGLNRSISDKYGAVGVLWFVFVLEPWMEASKERTRLLRSRAR